MALNSVALAPRQLSLVKRCIPPLLPRHNPFSVGRCYAIAAASKQADDGNLKVERKEEASSPSPARLPTSQTPSRLLADMMMMNPFNAAKSLVQMMNEMDSLFNSTFRSSSFGERINVRMPWDVMENEKEFKLRVDMPGLAKEDIKVRVDDGILLIEGVKMGSSDEEEKWTGRSYGRYQARILLPENVKADEINAEMKNGVLLLTVPKQEGKKEIHDIQVN